MSRKTIMRNIAFDSERKSFYVTLNEDGKRTVRCCKTLEQATALLARHTAHRTISRGDRMLTVEQWLCYWLDAIVIPSSAPTTAHGYASIVHNHLIPALGQIPLDELSPTQVQDYLRRKQREGLCANTVRKHHGVLHNALQQANRQELIDRNPVKMTVRPAATHPEHHFYDAQTMVKLFAAVKGTSLEGVVKLAGYLGLRRSEICALKWKNVDRAAKTITVAEARTAVNGRSIDKDTKNLSSVRALGYAGIKDLEELIERLWRERERERRKLGKYYDERGFVFCHDGGKPYQPDYLSGRFQRIVKEAGLPYVTLHGLRHSFASIAHSRNVPVFGISRALGHSNTATTTQIYMHLFDDTHLSVVQEVGRAIGEG